jgi:hypothetical protein
MFTWECPSCGKELDVDAQQCPKCGAQFGEPEEADSIIADPKPSAVSAPPPATPAPPPPTAPKAAQATTAPPTAAPTTVPPPTAAPTVQERPIAPSVQEQSAPGPTAAPAAYGIQGKHLAIVLVVLLMAVGGAVYLARPDLFQGRQDIALEDVPMSDTVGFASAAFGDLQVAGVRPFYSDDLKPKVRFVVINHGETPQAGASIQAHLSHKDAPLDSPPLASFVIAFNETLAPGESREIESDLMAFSTLAAFPPWKDLRIDLEVE